ncbi:ATP-dependent 6-phosphofructokinase [bacterium]|nr:ATP-dependent 6-phosphofructokinase [bacterium]
MKLSKDDFQVNNLGKCEILSPLNLSFKRGDGLVDYIEEGSKVLYHAEVGPEEKQLSNLGFEKAGPRGKIYFDPHNTTVGIVTCGGISPGLNNVLRSLYMELHYKYGVNDIFGFKYGFSGFDSSLGINTIKFARDVVNHIHKIGGTILGTSRGSPPTEVIVDTLEDLDIQILFCIGGDGTLRGAHEICKEIEKRGLEKSVVCVPKTIDNDIPFVFKTFGFDTAIMMSKLVIDCAHTEATGVHNGVVLVKLMGRESGFIASFATLACNDVNFTLIPEVPFDLEGENSFLPLLEKRILERGHAVIVVAEGAGQELIDKERTLKDLSGNLLFHDIGSFLNDKISEYFKKRNIPIYQKYMDPSYMIRGVPANANDGIFCDRLARHAVHAAMAGKTDIVLGLWYNVFTHVPLALVTSKKKRLSPESSLWSSVLSTTGQPFTMKNKVN